MNVPGVISLIGRLKEVLLSHGLQYPASSRLEACPTDPMVRGSPRWGLTVSPGDQQG
jgi:hypothetical protein